MTGAVVLAALAALLLVPAAADPSDLQRSRRCEDLKGRSLFWTARARVVSKPASGGRRYLGCALPGGTVRPLGDARPPSSTVSVSAPAGRFVLVRATRSAAADGRVVDLATGASYLVYRDLGDEAPQVVSKAPPIAWRLSALGVFAGVYPDLADDFTPARSVRAFTEAGRQKLLTRAAAPEIPAASLGLSGRTVTWTEAGMSREAEISAATPAYAPGLEPGIS